MKRNHVPPSGSASLTEKQFPLTTRVLGHIRKQGWTPERKAMVLKVFGAVMAHETSCDASTLLARAEQHPEESVEEIIVNFRKQP
jgi:hypothetical protein